MNADGEPQIRQQNTRKHQKERDWQRKRDKCQGNRNRASDMTARTRSEMRAFLVNHWCDICSVLAVRAGARNKNAQRRNKRKRTEGQKNEERELVF